MFNTRFNGIVNIPARVSLKQVPDGGIAFKSDFASLARRVEKERNNRVLADILGDVFWGIVCAHFLPFIHIFLENIAEDIGIDFVIVAQRPFIEVPLILLKEREEPVKRLIGDVNGFAVLLLDVMALKNAAVEIRHLAEALVYRRGAFGFRFREAFKKERTEERAVEPVGAFGLTTVEVRAEIVGIAVKKPLLLDEVDKHQPIEHDRDIRLSCLYIGDAVEELKEGFVFLFEAFIKTFGDRCHVKGGTDASRHINDGHAFFLRQAERKGLQFLEECVAGLFVMIAVFSARLGSSLFASDPLPDLGSFRGVGINDNVFVHRFRHLPLDGAPRGVVRHRFSIGGGAAEYHHAAFFSDSGERVFGVIYRDAERLRMILPTEFLNEEWFKVGVLEIVACLVDIELHKSYLISRNKRFGIILEILEILKILLLT